MLRFKSLCHASRTGPSSGKGWNDMQSSLRRLVWSVAGFQHGMPHAMGHWGAADQVGSAC